MDFDKALERTATIVLAIIAFVFFGSFAIAAAGMAADIWGII